MPTKRTYIDLINNFWDNYALRTVSAPAAMVYFYLINRINRNHWEPVAVSDVELAQMINVSRRNLPAYKGMIAAAGLLQIRQMGGGRSTVTVYELPENILESGSVNCEKRNRKKRPVNCEKRNRISDDESAQKGTLKSIKLRKKEQNENLFCAESVRITPLTPILISKDLDRIKTTTTNKDEREDALNFVVEVDAEETSFLSEKSDTSSSGVSELFLQKRERAKEQGSEVLKAFFDPSCAYTVECLCMQLHLTGERLKEIAKLIIFDWIQDGTTHENFQGAFDLSAAVKHLRMTIPKKAAALAAGDEAPKSRQRGRQDLMAGAMQNMRDAIDRQTDPFADTSSNPF